jgi:hypothetical protein
MEASRREGCNFRPGSNPSQVKVNSMTQADSVLSTPPTNTSKIPPVDPTRRHLLTVAAGGAVAVMAIGTTAQAAGSPADPIYAAIAGWRAAHAAHGRACDVLAEAETRFGFKSKEAAAAFEAGGPACDASWEAAWSLASTPPTTLAGVVAVLRFANEIEDTGHEWPDTGTIGHEGWHYQLRATMAAALEALLKAQGAKAVQS